LIHVELFVKNTRPLITSSEAIIQEEREKGVLSVQYLHPRDIPPTPVEPDHIYEPPVTPLVYPLNRIVEQLPASINQQQNTLNLLSVLLGNAVPTPNAPTPQWNGVNMPLNSTVPRAFQQLVIPQAFQNQLNIPIAFQNRGALHGNQPAFQPMPQHTRGPAPAADRNGKKQYHHPRK
jgi:hypothetical protein